MHANTVNRKKIAGSKWTAARPVDREKHFLVLGWTREPDGTLSSERVDLEAVVTGRVQSLAWRELANSDLWHIGWR